MSGTYVYVKNDIAVIGNDFIERCFCVKDKKLLTTAVINKRISSEKQLVFADNSAEFIVAFRRKRFFGYKTDTLSSSDLKIKNVDVSDCRLTFIFEPYTYNGAQITFNMIVELKDDNHYMHKYIEMAVAPEHQQLVTVDYIDCEHICFHNTEQMWTIGNIEKAYLSRYHSALGQPFYINGMFFGSEFPLCENKINKSTGFIRYFSGKSFDKLKKDNNIFRTWKTVAGAARSLDERVIREDFLTYIRDISRKVQPRFQYNSWYDHMHDITDENITKSFTEIEKGLSSTLVPPLDSYVVDDGFVDWKADFWSFNKKFPNELYPASALAKKFSSEFGLWNGPRGGYNDETGPFGKRMEKAGTGGYNKAADDVCVSSLDYIKNITHYYLDYTKKFDINYWKLDGFLLTACPSEKHGHMTGGYNDMYQYTEMWENWIDIFCKLRSLRESEGKDLWLNQTSYCNASPWFLQWADSLWIQNSGDIGFIDKTKKGEKLSSADVDRVLTYRDNCYYDFSVTRNYQFPHEFIYNHDPIYGNTAKISMTDDEFRRYMFMMATRGTAFWELYYSYNMFSKAKWQINADALRFIRNEYKTLKTSQFIGGCPEKGEAYGYSCWSEKKGIVSLRNPANRPQTFTFTLDEAFGTDKNASDMRLAYIEPYNKQSDGRTYSCGDTITVDLAPLEAVIMKFSSAEEKLPNLIYSRFDSADELLLFFDDRIVIDAKDISADSEIRSISLEEDYSTLRITFNKNVNSADVSLTVRNIFGDAHNIQLKAVYHPDFICKDNIIPCGRDFTVKFTLCKAENGRLMSIGDTINVYADKGLGAIRFADKKSCSDITLENGDTIAITSEPNGLVKLYINRKLACSVYNGADYCKELENCKVTLSENATDLKVMSVALPYDKI